MHLILGKVAYPIDWGTLGKEPIHIPVGIKFNIGELFVTPSRESIRYENPEKNALISSRIEETIQEIKKRYNKNSSIVDTLDEYVRQIALPDKILVIEDVEIKLPKKAVFDSKKGAYDNIDIIEGLENVKWKPLAHLPISIPEDPYLIFFIKGKIGRPDGRGNCKLEGTSKKNDFIFVQGNKDNVYRIKGDRNKATDLYLSWKHQGTKSPVLISKTYASYKTFCEALDLGKKVTKEVSGSILLGKKKIRTPIIFPITINGKTEYWNKLRIIQEYKKIITRDLISRTLSYEKEEPSAAYLSALQLARIAKKRPKLEGKITVYDLVNDNSSTGTELDLSSLEKYKGFIIYGEREKIKELQGVKEMLSNKAPIRSPRKTKIINTGKKIKKKFSSYHKPVEVYEFRTVEYGGKEISRTKKELYQAVIRNEAGRVLIVAKSNQKHLKENPYFMHVDEFMSNNNRMFRNAVTAWYINREFKIIRNTYSNLINNLARINDRLSKSYIELSRWVKTKWTPYYVNEDFMQVCLGIAKENNFLWQDKVEELEQIKAWFTPDLRIFQKMDDSVFQDENMFKDVIALLKMKHKRLSSEHYFVPTVEEEKIIEEAEEKKTYSLVVGEMTKKLLIYNNQKTA